MLNSLVLIPTHGKVTCLSLIKEMQQFGKVIVLVDEKQTIDWVDTFLCKNEWYDFGKLYHFFDKNTELVLKQDMITYTNDTICPLSSFTPLYDFVCQSDAEFIGACDWYSSEHNEEPYGYHLQSFFHCFKGKKIIQDLVGHYLSHGVIADKFDWVRCYETYFTGTMMAKWYKTDCFLKTDKLMHKYKRHRMDMDKRVKGIIEYDGTGELSPAFEYPVEMISEWLPFVKNSMFQYHFRPHDLLQHLAHKAYETSITQ